MKYVKRDFPAFFISIHNSKVHHLQPPRKGGRAELITSQLLQIYRIQRKRHIKNY